MKKHTKFLMPALLACLLLSACDASDPQTEFDRNIYKALSEASSMKDPWEAYQWLVLRHADAISVRNDCTHKWIPWRQKCKPSEAQSIFAERHLTYLKQATELGIPEALCHLYSDPVSFYDSYAGLRESQINALNKAIEKSGGADLAYHCLKSIKSNNGS